MTSSRSARPSGRPAKPRVVVLDPLHADALARLRNEHEVVVLVKPEQGRLRELVCGADALIVRSGSRITAEVLRAAAPRLRVVVRAGAGIDNIDIAAAKAAGVRVVNIPGVSARSVAELAIGLTLAVARHICLGDRQIRDGTWDKAGLSGMEIAGSTFGIVGLGSVGRCTAELARACGMRVVAAVARPTTDRHRALARDGITLMDLPELLALADVLCLAVPLTPETEHLIGTPQLGRMKRTAFLVNVSRGGVVAEDALVTALRCGQIAGAAMDVFSLETGTPALGALSNVVMTPHIGAMTEQAQARLGRLAAEAVRAVLRGEPALNTVC